MISNQIIILLDKTWMERLISVAFMTNFDYFGPISGQESLFWFRWDQVSNKTWIKCNYIFCFSDLRPISTIERCIIYRFLLYFLLSVFCKYPMSILTFSGPKLQMRLRLMTVMCHLGPKLIILINGCAKKCQDRAFSSVKIGPFLIILHF